MALVGLPNWRAGRRVQSSESNVDGVPDSVDGLEAADTHYLVVFNEPGTFGAQNSCGNWYSSACCTVTNEVTLLSSTASEGFGTTPMEATEEEFPREAPRTRTLKEKNGSSWGVPWGKFGAVDFLKKMRDDRGNRPIIAEPRKKGDPSLERVHGSPLTSAKGISEISDGTIKSIHIKESHMLLSILALLWYFPAGPALTPIEFTHCVISRHFSPYGGITWIYDRAMESYTYFIHTKFRFSEKRLHYSPHVRKRFFRRRMDF